MFLSGWLEFPSAPCLAKKEKKTFMTARVSMLLKSRASLTCFRTCALPGRAKDLSAPRYLCRRKLGRGARGGQMSHHYFFISKNSFLGCCWSEEGQ